MSIRLELSSELHEVIGHFHLLIDAKSNVHGKHNPVSVQSSFLPKAPRAQRLRDRSKARRGGPLPRAFVNPSRDEM